MGDIDDRHRGDAHGRSCDPQISAEFVDVTASFANECAIVNGVGGVVLKSHENYFKDPANISILEKGDVLFTFTCRKARASPYEKEMLRLIANLSSFQDEVKENCVPPFDVRSESDLKKFTFVLQKCAYLLPNVEIDSLALPEFVSTVEYHTSCQPRGTKVWKDVTEECTFRITKPIIPRIFSITMQLKVSMIEAQDLAALSKHMGIHIDRGLLMERTRRTKHPKPDATAKAKSVLLYTSIRGGLLVTHATVVLNKGLPEIITKIIDTFGSWGLREVCETAALTRCYLRNRMALSPHTCFDNNSDKKKRSKGKDRDETEVFHDVLNDDMIHTETAEKYRDFFDASFDDDSVLSISAAPSIEPNKANSNGDEAWNLAEV